MSSLHRTQVYMEDQQMLRLRLEAHREHLPISELIRRAVERFLRTKESRTDWDRDPLTRAIGKIRLSVSDASVRHDEYLYGPKKKH